MLMGDLLSLVRLKLPVKVIVFNNGALGFVELEQKSTGFLNSGTDLVNPNFAALAEAVGIKGARIEGRQRSSQSCGRRWDIRGRCWSTPSSTAWNLRCTRASPPR